MAPRRPEPTVDVARARRYAAHVRITIALVGLGLLAVDRAIDPHPLTAALGLAVIGVTGVVESVVRHQRWLRFEEALSCLAAILIVGFGGGQVTVVTIIWLVAAAVGVLARGGRVGAVGRLLVLAALLSPLVTQGTLTAENVGLAVGAIALLLATGRVSRETVELLRRARHDADHDALTGLLARDAFRVEVDRLAGAATRLRPGALIVLDLDDFGAVNKRRGHAAGDALLASSARAMEDVLRGHDRLGRMGGDEFAVFVAGDDPDGVARRLIDAVSHSGQTCACAGIARCPRDGQDAEALLAAADVALRVAKRSGKREVATYEGAPLLASGSEGARGALERMCTGDGLAMAVQPIVDAETGRAHAYEALARFASRGGEGPLHWFALADELGMRAELELACLRAALDLLPELPAGTRLSVNLSAPLLGDRRTLDQLAACDDVSRLIVEVTEETLVRDGPAILRAIAALRSRGVLFAVDDIGAGYSGLGQLATLRPSYLKLDRGLVQGIDSEPDRVSLVRALAEYARNTGGLLVAEGVETPAELAEIRAAGVPLVQGFLFAKPDPPWPRVPLADHAWQTAAGAERSPEGPRGADPLPAR
jgi:diguanylate cyclase (GGDEF)-like protein